MRRVGLLDHLEDLQDVLGDGVEHVAVIGSGDGPCRRVDGDDGVDPDHTDATGQGGRDGVVHLHDDRAARRGQGPERRGVVRIEFRVRFGAEELRSRETGRIGRVPGEHRPVEADVPDGTSVGVSGGDEREQEREHVDGLGERRILPLLAVYFKYPRAKSLPDMAFPPAG